MDLVIKNLSKNYKKKEAVKNVDATLSPGIWGLLGANGAGKTTLFNLLSGQLKPTKGEIYFKGENVTSYSIPMRTRLGIGRSFQLTNIFPELSVLENIRLAVQAEQKDFFRFIPTKKKYLGQQEEARRLLNEVMLEGKKDVLAKDLAHGEKRKLELAMLMALKTELLLLDEPTAGISVEEVPAILKVIEKIKMNGSSTIVLIEHKMDMVMHLSDQIAVLFHGELLAEGSPSEIMQNERVQNAYLGGLYHDSLKSG